MAAGIITGIVSAKNDITLLARIVGQNGQPITQSSLSAITYAIRDRTNGTTITSGSLTIANVVFNALQQSDARWTKDSEAAPGADGLWGYNFLADFAGSNFPGRTASESESLPDISYRVDVQFATSGGYQFVQSWEFTAKRVYL